MTALELKEFLEYLETNGNDLSNIYIAIANGNDLIFADEVRDIEDVIYIDPSKDQRSYLVIQYEDIYRALKDLGEKRNQKR